ncbi:Kunitz-type serine protease inhibitor 4 [Trichostrongylus colubriformis]|uniref:Kunitz-type serine protease inhibitor 4 n=1 Tax=Trichostrongylus colubriformis TaxID=6319 RepID=A0AAN8F3M7_TRICO
MKLLLAVLFAVLTIAFSLDAVCRLKHKSGRCRALFKRYGYSTKEKKCVMFFYGGCGGNGNNFLTKEECKKKCH